MKLKPIVLNTALVILLFSPATGLAQGKGLSQDKRSGDLAFGLTAMRPKQTDIWDSAEGVDLRYYFWNLSALDLMDEIGLVIAAGYQTWSATGEDSLKTTTDPDGNIFELQERPSGEATVIPIGASVVFHQELYDEVKGIIEGGFRYVMVDSDITRQTSGRFGSGDRAEAFSRSEKVDIDNAVIGLMAANVHFPIYHELGGYVGLGWQFDIFRGDSTSSSGEVRKNRLQAAYVQIGLTW